MCFIKMGGINRGGNWQNDAAKAAAIGGGLLGLGALGYKGYKAYDKANFIKEAATNIASPISPILQMIPLY